MNFDERLRISKGSYQYHLDKVKGGYASSSAGKPRPYAKQNMRVALFSSPRMVGHTLVVKPKHNFSQFHIGKLYECFIIERGVGIIEGEEFQASEIKEHFILVPKRK